jgi:hypothetical protein
MIQKSSGFVVLLVRADGTLGPIEVFSTEPAAQDRVSAALATGEFVQALVTTGRMTKSPSKPTATGR